MSLAVGRTLLPVLMLVAALPGGGKAQIYLWRDAPGTIVLSDRPKNPSAVVTTYAVRDATPFRTTAGIERAGGAIRRLIEENAAVHGVSPHLVRAVIQQESAFNPNARSLKGAMGLMQLMPATAAELGVSDPYNPSENIRGGVAYLKGLLVKFQHNVELALAAYNAGPTAVTKYGTVPPYRDPQLRAAHHDCRRRGAATEADFQNDRDRRRPGSAALLDDRDARLTARRDGERIVCQLLALAQLSTSAARRT